MTKRGIVRGQPVSPTKQKLARQLRQQMTEAEQILWAALRRKQFGGLRFRRQQVIDGWIVDFYCHALGLVIEVDGNVHDRRQKQDQARDNVLRQRGLTLVRLRNEQVTGDLAATLAALQQLIATLPPTPALPPEAGKGDLLCWSVKE